MAFILVAGAVSAAGSIGSSIIGANAASDSAAMQAAAAQKANKKQQKMYVAQRESLKPWTEAGTNALSGLQNQDFQRDFTAADFQADPGYEFRMAEGQKALERSAAAKGGLQSGGFMKGLARYSQGVASDEYGKAYDRFNSDRDRRFGRLSSIAGMGQNAVGQLNAARQNYANQYGANLTGSANAQGAANMAQANAIGGAISSIGQTGMDMYAQNQQGKWMDQWLSKQK